MNGHFETVDFCDKETIGNLVFGDGSERLAAHQKKHGVPRTMENLKISRKFVRDMLASAVGPENFYYFWVDIRGRIHFEAIGPQGWPKGNHVAFRLETLSRGAGYCGPEAAADPKYVDETCEWIARCWLHGSVGHETYFDWEPTHDGSGPDPYRPPTD